MATENKAGGELDFTKVAKLVKKVQKGNAKAYTRLYELYFSRIYFSALRYLKDEQESAEITQDVFVKAYQSITTLKDPKAFHKWINTITYNLSLNKLTRRRNQGAETVNTDISTYEDDLPVDREDFIPHDYLDIQEGRDFVLALVDGLPEAQRTAVTMYYFDELSVADIAEITQSSSGTVRKRLHDAKTTLRRKVDERDKGDVVKRYGAAAVPVLAGIMQAGALELSSNDALKQSIYKGVATTLGAAGVTLPATLGGPKPTGASTVAKVGLATGVAGVVIAGGIYAYNANHVPTPEPSTPPAVEQKQESAQTPTEDNTEAIPQEEEATEPPAPSAQDTPEQEQDMPTTVPTQKDATVASAPPQITVAHNTLVYPLGEKVALAQILRDAGISATDASGKQIAYEAAYYNAIDFFVEGSYALPINAVDSSGTAARTAVIVIYVASDSSQ